MKNALPQTFALSQLQSLTQVGESVSFLSGSTPTTTSESGPTLATCSPESRRHSSRAARTTSSAPLVSLVEYGASLANVGSRVVQNADVRGGRLVSGTSRSPASALRRASLSPVASGA